MSIDIGPDNGHISMEDGAESDDSDGSFPMQEGNRVELYMVLGTFFAVLWKCVLNKLCTRIQFCLN